MIAGIGIDTVDIARFQHWPMYTNERLRRIFSPHEITYCRALTAKSPERFAARFAAKEAFYKAFTAANPTHAIPFLTICAAIHITLDQRAPKLIVDWHKLNTKPYLAHVSLTHTDTSATALVILEQ